MSNGAPETPGSSAVTATNVAIGAVAGATVIAVAPVLLPALGLGIVATGLTAVGVPVAAVVGGWLGWKMGGKT
ncbi:MAG: hypothetical protein MN733_03210 [Nitrososphaera sp.]|nr:hypothetical protein [Nitrososphaera sp.]